MISQPSAVLALAILSFMITVIWGSPLIRLLKMIKVGDNIRLELSNKIHEKAGTPTMGGIMFVMPVILLTVMINAVSLINPEVGGRSVMLPIFTMLAFGLLGSVDDLEKLQNKAAGEGMRARTKFILQILIAAAIAYALFAVFDAPQMYLPGFAGEIKLGWWYVPIAAIIIAGMANAVNFTDGFDGLAGLICATGFAAYGGVALIQGQIFLAQFCFILVGALFGFLWFNVHPAQLFMGDTGSLPLGAVMGVVALMTGQWLILPVIAIIPISEMLSVILQVAYFKISGGKRIFKMSPIHYHFELSGWSETQIVQRFWLVSLMAAIIGIAMAVI